MPSMLQAVLAVAPPRRPAAVAVAPVVLTGWMNRTGGGRQAEALTRSPLAPRMHMRLAAAAAAAAALHS